MPVLIERLLSGAPWQGTLALLLDLAIKSGLVLATAATGALLLRRSSAYTRNLVWVFALAGLLVLPFLSLGTPVWQLSILPEPGSWGASSYTPEYSKLAQDDFVGPPYVNAGTSSWSASPDQDAMPLFLPWYAWVVLAWLAGGLLYFSYHLVSIAAVRSIVRTSRCVTGRWQKVFEMTAHDLGLKRSVRLLESDRVRTAITVGVFSPVVVLPGGSSGWKDDRIRLVLSHELAHVKRWDTLIEILALLVTVLYWFNPLVWVAVKQLRIERERDCDDAVLCAGVRPSDYAEMLMKIAADLGESARPVWQLSTISQGSNLKDRLMSILNPRVDRTRGGRRSAFVTGLIVLAVVFTLSVSGIWSTQAQEPPKKQKQAQSEQELKEKQQKKEQLKKEQLKNEQIKKEGGIKPPKKELSQKEKLEKVRSAAAETFKKLTSDESSAAGQVAMVMKKKGAMAGMKMFKKIKNAEDAEYRIDEKEFNRAGYMFLSWGKTDEAITMFKINTIEFPDSWNVYDSLGEAYMVAGKHIEARKNYEMALKLNPKAGSAKKALAELDRMASI